LIVSFFPHPLIPSPACSIVYKKEIFKAGEGSFRERGLRPLLKSVPLSNKKRNMVN
jgi:hypothetical protein